MADSEYLHRFVEDIAEIARQIDLTVIDRMVERLVRLRAESGRLFLCGVGGAAATCSHAVNDFRKLDGIEAYTPLDNVSGLTAHMNDEGWDTVFSTWLQASHACSRDVLCIVSVGGGSRERNISRNLVVAIEEATRKGMDVLGVVGRDGGDTKRRGNLVLVIPTVNDRYLTPHTEAWQGIVLHAVACDPRLMVRGNKWERTLAAARGETVERLEVKRGL